MEFPVLGLGALPILSLPPFHGLRKKKTVGQSTEPATTLMLLLHFLTPDPGGSG